MSLGCGLMLAAILVARFCKSRKWWMKVHKALNYGALASLAAGLTCAVIMVEAAGETPEGTPHRIAGAVAAAGALGMILLGLSIFKQKGKDEIASRKTLHRWSGRFEALLMLGVITLGLVIIGVI